MRLAEQLTVCWMLTIVCGVKCDGQPQTYGPALGSRWP
jgi:hypothetical protein